MPTATAIAVLVFVAVLILIIWQPRGLSIGWTATAGAIAVLATGVVSVADVRTVIGIVWDATLTFVALILISLILDAAGVFEWAALHIARAARGSGRRLFFGTLLLGAMVAALFANDGAALILTPIVYQMMRALRSSGETMLAFVMAMGFIADTTSLPFTISNLVNILSADYFHIGFVSYAVRMIPVDVVSLLASLGMVWLVFRRAIPPSIGTGDLPDPSSAIRDRTLFVWMWPVLGLLLAGYAASEFLHLPVSLFAGGAAVLFTLFAAMSPNVQVRRLIPEAPWKVVVFSIGMYLVVFGLRNVGLTAIVTGWIASAVGHGRLAGTLATGALSAGMSAVMNNMPTVMVNALAIHGVHATSQGLALPLANVVGSDLGPKMTPIGSLATLLWLHTLGKKGVHIGWGYYMRMGLVLTLPVLAATLLALAAIV